MNPNGSREVRAAAFAALTAKARQLAELAGGDSPARNNWMAWGDKQVPHDQYECAVAVAAYANAAFHSRPSVLDGLRAIRKYWTDLGFEIPRNLPLVP